LGPARSPRPRSRRDPERAKAALQQVAADAGSDGALRLRDGAARELRRLGTRVTAEARRASRGTARGHLTEREGSHRRSRGRRTLQQRVAATLFLSEKTVANALTRVYTKLGVRSRTQLARSSPLRDLTTFAAGRRSANPGTAPRAKPTAPEKDVRKCAGLPSERSSRELLVAHDKPGAASRNERE
jgi:DNA-binding CsgD family transcriptional regulator